MNAIHIVLVVSTVLCSLVAGLVLTFAVIVMPGIAKLRNREYLSAFKVMDGVIQDNQPVFVLVWAGSLVSTIALIVLSIWQLSDWERWSAMIHGLAYLLGVQLPTFTINIPLNNKLQSLDLEQVTEPELSDFRNQFEKRWVFWNNFRTVISLLVSVGFCVLCLKL